MGTWPLQALSKTAPIKKIEITKIDFLFKSAFLLKKTAWNVPIAGEHSWDGIVSTRIEGIAAQHPPDRHPGSLPRTVFVYSLIAVVRTGRIEATGIGRQSRGNNGLIRTDQR
jgi:hypothetical protein